MKSLIKNAVKKTLLSPPYIKYSSQTVYQALLYTVRMYKFTNKVEWKEEVRNLTNILISIQRPDGGFDIGYDFNFGLLHKKGDSTSPELYSVYALVQAYGVLEDSSILRSLEKAKQWIEFHSVYTSLDEAYLPYSPYNTKDVIVYNGTSFALGAYSAMSTLISIDKNLLDAMSRYLIRNIHKNEEYGYIWYYNDQNRTDIDDIKKNKIDFYHQAQQIEMHCLYFFSQDKVQLGQAVERIVSTFMSLVELSEKNTILPYANENVHFGNNIHVWGLSSFISAYVGIRNYLNTEQQKKAEKQIKKTISWLFETSLSCNYFVPVLNETGRVFDPRYMVRSDAWVINSIVNYLVSYDTNDTELKRLELVFERMKSADFSGIENHASNKRVRFMRVIRDRLQNK